MELRRLGYFTVLAADRHFGRAAARLHIAQSGLSQQIQVLERELGLTLFDRTNRGVELTAEGRALLPKAKALLEHASDFEDEARALATSGMRRLRIAYTRSGVELGAPALVSAFRDSHPAFDVHTRSGWTTINVQQLLDRDVDIAFVRSTALPSALRHLVVRGDELVAVLPEQHPLARRTSLEPSDLQVEPLVMWPRDQGPQFHDELMAQIWGEHAPTLVLEEPEAEHLIAAVAAGLGVTVLDRLRAERLLQDGIAIRPFTRAVLSTPLSIAWNADDHSAGVAAFVDHAARRIAPPQLT